MDNENSTGTSHCRESRVRREDSCGSGGSRRDDRESITGGRTLIDQVLRKCKKCGRMFFSTDRLPDGLSVEEIERWRLFASKLPGLCDSCEQSKHEPREKRTARSSANAKDATPSAIEREVAELGLPALKPGSETLLEKAYALRKLFFMDQANLKLYKLFRYAPQAYYAATEEKREKMLEAVEKTGWGDNFRGAFAYANAELDDDFYNDLLGARLSGGPREYMRILQQLTIEIDAKEIIILLRREP